MAAPRRQTTVAPRPLSEPMTALLRDGVGIDNYGSRSEAVMATAVAAVNAGWDQDTWRAALEAGYSDLASWSSTQVRKGRARQRSAADAERHLVTTWRNATERVRLRPPTTDHFSVRAELAEIAATADTDPTAWSRAAGVTDRAVLAVLLDVATAACTLTPSASTRQISEAANISPTTAWKSLQRLVGRGWIRQDSAASGTLAAGWRLLRPETLPEPPAAVAQVLEALPPRRPLTATGARTSVRGHDAFAHTVHGGLGRVAARLYDLLDPSGEHLTAEQLSALSGLHPRTVAKHLHALVQGGLIDVDAAGYQRAADAAGEWLDSLAEELGCAGVTTRRRQRHLAQREAFVAYRTDFQARRGWAVQRGLYRPHEPQLPIPAPRAA